MIFIFEVPGSPESVSFKVSLPDILIGSELMGATPLLSSTPDLSLPGGSNSGGKLLVSPLISSGGFLHLCFQRLLSLTRLSRKKRKTQKL